MRVTTSSLTFWITGIVGAAWIGNMTPPVAGNASGSGFFYMPIAGPVLFIGAVIYFLFASSAWRMGPRWSRPWVMPLIASALFTLTGVLCDRTRDFAPAAFSQAVLWNYLPILFWAGLGRVSQRVQLIAPDPEDSFGNAS